jgi:hypothetical protein
VCKSGGIYDAEWVRKLHDGVKRNLTIPHRFRCLSDMDVPCGEKLEHDWPKWWPKLELFRPGVIQNPTLYLDLDTIVTGPLDAFRNIHTDFAMLRSFWNDDMVGSGVMWFSGDNVPHGVYTKFSRQADAYIAHYKRVEHAPYIGDQAFIWDTLNRDIAQVNDWVDGIYSYKFHCSKRLPKDARIVCFHGHPRITELDHDWLKEHWR